MFKIANELLQKMKEKIVGYTPAFAHISNNGGAIYDCSLCSNSCTSCMGTCAGNCSGDCMGSCHSYSR